MSETHALGTPGVPPAALLVELCGVLYDDSAWRRWMLQLLARMGVHTHYAAFYQVWEQEHFARVCSGETDFWAAMRAFLHTIGLPPGRVDEACAAGASRRRQWDRSIRPLPGVASTLACLRGAGVPVAVIAHASFDQATAVDKLRQLGLEQYVSHGVLATAELGRAGAYRDRFAEAARRFETPIEQLTYLGCGRQPLRHAAADGLQCLAYNTDLTQLDCPLLEQFIELNDQPWSVRRRLAG